MLTLLKIVVFVMAFAVLKSADVQDALFENRSTMNDIPVKGNIKAPDFPAYADWLNTDRSVLMADLNLTNGLLYIVGTNNHAIRIFNPENNTFVNMKNRKQ
jgi:hypothetical protein